MSTSFKKIYDKFLLTIDDYELGMLEDSDLSELLELHLESAITDFPQCEKDLENIIYYDDDVPHFSEDLSLTEQKILAMCMRKSWLSSKLYNADLMRKEVGDRDYNAVQGTSYIRALSELDDKINDEIRTYSVGYTYSDFSLEDW